MENGIKIPSFNGERIERRMVHLPEEVLLVFINALRAAAAEFDEGCICESGCWQKQFF